MGAKEQLVFRALCDEESKVNYEARTAFTCQKSLYEFYKIIRKNQITYRFRDMDAFLVDKEIDGWCVWGTDDIGLYHHAILSDAGFYVAGAVESLGHNQGKQAETPLISIDHVIELVSKKKYALLIADSQTEDLPKELMDCENVLCVKNHLVGRCGWQYFDFFSAGENEVFIDGGALDGVSSKEFIRWCNGNFDKIFAFEPNPKMIEVCRENLKNMSGDKITFASKALWKENVVLHFDNQTKEKWDACLDKRGNVEVACISIDEAVKMEKVTFIKLDVEGSELEALMGAEECIKRDRPRLAVSIYHKDHDYVDIPAYLLSLDASYRFGIRHYHSDCIETVLYAF